MLRPMTDFMFIDNDTGEEFFVECFSLNEAWKIAYETFGEDADLEFIDEYTIREAEEIGLDTY